MLLNLKKLGEHEGKIPSSIATCLDFRFDMGFISQIEPSLEGSALLLLRYP